jgi:hypothetical protein
VGFLRANGWPPAERRALNGSTDRGDITGTPGVAWEVKYAGAGLKVGEWLGQTHTERLNAGADYGVLVMKPSGLGVTKVGSWYAVMTDGDFTRLKNQAGEPAYSFFILRDREPTYYTAATLRFQLTAATKPDKMMPGELVALLLRPPKTKERPEAWYRVMTLEHMTHLLRSAGYGDRHVPVDLREEAPSL